MCSNNTYIQHTRIWCCCCFSFRRKNPQRTHADTRPPCTNTANQMHQHIQTLHALLLTWLISANCQLYGTYIDTFSNAHNLQIYVHWVHTWNTYGTDSMCNVHGNVMYVLYFIHTVCTCKYHMYTHTVLYTVYTVYVHIWYIHVNTYVHGCWHIIQSAAAVHGMKRCAVCTLT